MFFSFPIWIHLIISYFKWLNLIIPGLSWITVFREGIRVWFQIGRNASDFNMSLVSGFLLLPCSFYTQCAWGFIMKGHCILSNAFSAFIEIIIKFRFLSYDDDSDTDRNCSSILECLHLLRFCLPPVFSTFLPQCPCSYNRAEDSALAHSPSPVIEPSLSPCLLPFAQWPRDLELQSGRGAWRGLEVSLTD